MTADDRSVEASTAHPLFQRVERFRRRAGRVREDVIVMAHGGGGKAMRDLLDDLVVGELGTEALAIDEDQARFPPLPAPREGGPPCLHDRLVRREPAVFPGW